MLIVGRHEFRTTYGLQEFDLAAELNGKPRFQTHDSMAELMPMDSVDLSEWREELQMHRSSSEPP